ncbi:replication initiator [Antribacter gilvus]|uniref:replication initiator n=1 Tax=Antribacter gilvus TaxID=2304675 RepID=UPI000F781187|nr:replication initiator [Antribacter gilvus]
MTATLTGFPGFGPDAPLDLGDLSGAAVAGILGRLRDKSMLEFAETAERVGFCSHPIRLVGSSMTVDARTGEVLGSFASKDAPLGELYTPCGNRRADVCPACSRVYARDTFEMIRAGALGGKTVPAKVADNPLVFATLTAPSFGHVHAIRTTEDGKKVLPCRPQGKGKTCPHGRPMWCWTKHTDTDAKVGEPLCPDCYDWSSAVVWQWWSPELWRRFTIALRRRLAFLLGTSESGLRERAQVEYAKVAEFQARGMVHFHALVRLDGPNTAPKDARLSGAGNPAPLDGQALQAAVEHAIQAVEFTAPPVDGADAPRSLSFGAQWDVRIVRTGLPDNPDGTDGLTPEQVAGYLAKYSTKSTGADPAAPRPHLARMVQTARWLAERAATACRTWDGPDRNDDDGCWCGECVTGPYRLLGKWARMLAFRGHFSSKSRAYTISLGRLRTARARYARLRAEADRAGEPLDLADLEARLLAADAEETTLVIGSWDFHGSGWLNTGDKALADAAAARAREYAKWKANNRHTA